MYGHISGCVPWFISRYIHSYVNVMSLISQLVDLQVYKRTWHINGYVIYPLLYPLIYQYCYINTYIHRYSIPVDGSVDTCLSICTICAHIQRDITGHNPGYVSFQCIHHLEYVSICFKLSAQVWTPGSVWGGWAYIYIYLDYD